MSYKWSTSIGSLGIFLFSTYGSGNYSAGTYNGAAASGDPITVGPIIAGPIALGPITLPVTGSALGGIILIAAAAALAVWAYQHRKMRKSES